MTAPKRVHRAKTKDQAIRKTKKSGEEIDWSSWTQGYVGGLENADWAIRSYLETVERKDIEAPSWWSKDGVAALRHARRLIDQEIKAELEVES